MNTKNILILTMILALLGAGLWYRKAARQSQDLMTTESLHRFAPQDLDLNTVTTVEVNGPDNATVRLDKTETGWVVASLDNAPANAAAIEHLLETIRELRGELRANDDAVLPDFQLDTAQAVRLTLRQGQTEALRLLLGKGDFRTVFVREADSTAVHVAPGTLLTQLGLKSRTPSAQFWIDTNLLSLAPSDLRELRLSTPEAEATLTRADQPEANATNATTAPSWTFRLTTGKGLTKAQLEGVVPALARVSSAEILPADDQRRAGLDQAPYVLTIRTANTSMTIRALRPDPKADAVVRLDGSAHAYTMRGTVFERLFPNSESPAKTN